MVKRSLIEERKKSILKKILPFYSEISSQTLSLDRVECTGIKNIAISMVNHKSILFPSSLWTGYSLRLS